MTEIEGEFLHPGQTGGLEDALCADGRGPAGGETPADSLDIEPTRFITTTMFLTWVSAVAATAEYSGENDILPNALEEIATSLAHPAPGYIAGGAAALLTHNRSRKTQVTSILAAATIANFAVEKIQSMVVATPEFVDFMSQQNLPETAKDYAAALAGAGLLIWQGRNSQ